MNSLSIVASKKRPLAFAMACGLAFVLSSPNASAVGQDSAIAGAQLLYTVYGTPDFVSFRGRTHKEVHAELVGRLGYKELEVLRNSNGGMVFGATYAIPVVVRPAQLQKDGNHVSGAAGSAVATTVKQRGFGMLKSHLGAAAAGMANRVLPGAGGIAAGIANDVVDDAVDQAAKAAITRPGDYLIITPDGETRTRGVYPGNELGNVTWTLDGDVPLVQQDNALRELAAFADAAKGKETEWQCQLLFEGRKGEISNVECHFRYGLLTSKHETK